MEVSHDESHGFRLEEGGAIAGLGKPSFVLKSPKSPPLPVLISVPHAGRDYPTELLRDLRDADYARLRLEDRLIDKIGAEVARLTGAVLLTAHAPRAMLDLNRSCEDVDWEMIAGMRKHPLRHSVANRRARGGLGLVPRRLAGVGEIWRRKLTHEGLDARIMGIHRPYHSVLARELASLRDIWGDVLLVDLHSMPPLKQSTNGSKPARFVIGDRFGTACDVQLASSAYGFFDQRGWAVAHNQPYAGGYILDTHASPKNGMHGIQLEVCRSTYLDDHFDQLSSSAGEIVELLADFIQNLGLQVAQLSDGTTLDLAAE